MIDVDTKDYSNGHRVVRQRLYAQSGHVPRWLRGTEVSDLGGIPASAQDPLRRWFGDVIAGKVIRGTGVGLVLYGNPGTGKTTLATAIFNELLWRAPLRTVWGHTSETYQHRLGYWTDYAGYLERRKALFDLAPGDPAQDRARMADQAVLGMTGTLHGGWDAKLLVLDDLSKEYRAASRYGETTFDHLLRHRFNMGYPTIITTNVPPKDWGAVYNESMGSFVQQALIPVPLIGRDRRVDGLAALSVSHEAAVVQMRGC